MCEDDSCLIISLKDVTQLIRSKAKAETPNGWVLSCVCSRRGGQQSLHTLVHEEHLVCIFAGVIFWKLPAATASCQVSPKCSSFLHSVSELGLGREGKLLKQTDQLNTRRRQIAALKETEREVKVSASQVPLECMFVAILLS